MPAGEVPSNPSELLGSKRMRKLVEELKARFEYVIIDAPSIVALTDSGVVGSQVDGVVLVVRAHKTRKEDVKHALNLFKQARSNVVGLVLTHVDYTPKYYYY